MKPLVVKMTAFGPYKEQEVIDFRKLGTHRLFAVAGTTGAGKTTIFDAISFALYGAASGSERSDTQGLRSDFADDNIDTAVELLFEMRGKTYRVLRKPGHKKAGNKSVTGMKYELVEITAQGEEIALTEKSQVGEINKKLLEIMGLTQAQFSQIVMLPQGEFRKLLTSDSVDKEQLLRKIFNTEIYDNITKQMDAKRKTAEVALQKVEAKKAHYISELTGALPERDSQLQQVLQMDTVNIHQLQKALAEEQQHYAEAVSEQQVQYEKAKANSHAMHKVWQDIISTNLALQQQQKRLEQQQLLNEQTPVIRKIQQQMAIAQQANSLEPYILRYEEAEQDNRISIQNYEKAQQQLEAAQQANEEAEAQWQMQQEKEAERLELQKSTYYYEQLVPQMVNLEKQQQQLQTLAQTVVTITATKVQLDEQKDVEEAHLASCEQQLQKNEVSIEQLQDAPLQLEKALQQQAEIEELLAQQELATQKQAFMEQAQQNYEQAKAQYYAQQQQWLDNQAANLAANLVDGEPCPVCGSKHHEAQQFTSATSIDDATLAKSEQAWQKAQQDYMHAQADYQAITTQLTGFANKGIYAQDKAKIDGRVQQAQIDAKAYQTARAERQHNQQQKQEFVQALQTTAAQVAELGEQLQQAQQKVLGCEASIASIQENLPEHITSLSKLQQQLQQAQLQYQALQRAFETAEANVQNAQQACKVAQAAQQFALQNRQQVEQKYIEHTKKIQQQLTQKNIATLAEARAQQASEQQLQKWQQQCEDFTQQQQILQQQIAVAASALEGKTTENEFVAEQNYNTAQQEVETAYEQQSKLQGYVDKCHKYSEQLAQNATEITAFEETAGKVRDLFEMLNGKNAQRISFERFVQIRYLEQIIQAANIRLNNLSNGQYRLLRSQRIEKHGAQSGLMLDVYDSYTDAIRDVKTLSGGEKFNASLSLALGMSDVVQSFKGNIHIDTMFIDEGFGTLDEESLLKAIDTLIDLQASGRMIGVISHVAELKAAMPAVLQVEKTKEGYSKTKFTFK